LDGQVLTHITLRPWQFCPSEEYVAFGKYGI
jgi:hypothetical protein